jgi:hypothetical protein
MTKQIPGLIIPRLILGFNSWNQARLEYRFRNTKIGADESDRVSRLFSGNYEELQKTFQQFDPKDLWPVEKNALYGLAIKRDLDEIYSSYFFGGPKKDDSFDLNAFLTFPTFIGDFTSQKIAHIETESKERGVVRVKNRLYYPTIAGTVDSLNSKTGLSYRV